MTYKDVLELEEKFPRLDDKVVSARIRKLNMVMSDDGYTINLYGCSTLTSYIKEILKFTDEQLRTAVGLISCDATYPLYFSEAITIPASLFFECKGSGYYASYRCALWHIFHESDDDFNYLLKIRARRN